MVYTHQYKRLNVIKHHFVQLHVNKCEHLNDMCRTIIKAFPEE